MEQHLFNLTCAIERLQGVLERVEAQLIRGNELAEPRIAVAYPQFITSESGCVLRLSAITSVKPYGDRWSVVSVDGQLHVVNMTVEQVYAMLKHS